MCRPGYNITPNLKPLLSRKNRWRKQAEAIDLSDRAKLRLEWIIFYHTAGKKSAADTAFHFGITRSKFYYWFSRFDETNLRTLENRPSVPKSVNTWSPEPCILERMTDLRKEFMMFGKMKLKALHEKKHKESIASWQFQRTMLNFKLYSPIKKEASIKRKRKDIERITKDIRVSTPHLFSLDAIEIHHFGKRRYILTGISRNTKIGYARVYSSHTSFTARDFLKRLMYLVDGNIEVILTDNGSEFQKHFEKACQKAKLKRYYTRPRMAQDNPEAERFNKTIQYEWLYYGNYSDNLYTMNKRLTDWLITYNFIRPHEALSYLTPIEHAEKHRLLSKRWSSCTHS